MSVTIREVAEAAHVSRGTVDRALHGRLGVNERTAKHIKEIADQMGYVPDPTARSLASKRYKKQIKIIICSKGNPFFDDVKIGIHDALSELANYGIKGEVLEIKGFDQKSEIRILEELSPENIDGVVITPVNSASVALQMKKLSEKGIPSVTINTDVNDSRRIAYIGADYVAGGNLGGKLIGLMSNGCSEKVIFVMGSKKVKAQYDRLKGIIHVLKKEYPNIKLGKVLENDDDDNICYQMVNETLSGDKEISIVCFVSAGVEGGLKAVKACQTEKPYKIITYDFTKIVKDNLKDGIIQATICSEPYQQGYQGVMVLGRYLVQNTLPENAVIYTHSFIITKYNMMSVPKV